MRILASAIALAVALAWPTVSDAQSQSKKSTARSTAAVQQKQVKRKKTTHARTATGPVRREQRPCAGYLWWGCVGWDPDPRIRSTLVRDLADTP